MLAARYPGKRLRVMPNPVMVPDCVTAVEQREKIIVNVASMGRMKNQRALIVIFSRLTGNSAWRLILIGDGPGRSRLEAEVRQLGMEDRIEFLGEQKDILVWLDRARVFAFTSLEEGFPNALAEALAAGCACVSYDCPTGPSDLIQHERNGLLLANGDEAAFAQQLERLISDEAMQIRLSRQARIDIDRFSEADVFSQFDGLVAEALGCDKRATIGSCDS